MNIIWTIWTIWSPKKTKTDKGVKLQTKALMEKFRPEVEADGLTIDSGASRHMLQCLDILKNVKIGPTYDFHTANGEILKGHLYRNLKLHLESNNGHFNTVELTDVLVVD